MTARRASLALVFLAAALAAGVAWGVASQIGDGFRGGRWLTALGAPWLVLAFAFGASSRTMPWWYAAACGAGLLVSGVLAYYLVHYRLGTYVNPRGLAVVFVGWSAVAAPAGAIFAAAGRAWRGGSVLAAALPLAALVGEALALSTEWRGEGAAKALLLELGLAALLIPVLTRGGRYAALPVAAVLAIACGIAEHEVRETLRAAGWHGL